MRRILAVCASATAVIGAVPNATTLGAAHAAGPAGS